MANERAIEYANGDNDFAEWLTEIDNIVLTKYGLSVFDLCDFMFRSSFDAGEDPEEFFEEIVEPEIGF